MKGMREYSRGSCRHFIRFAGGNRDVEITPDDSSDLDRLVKESKALEITSAQQLGVLATNFEELFTKLVRAINLTLLQVMKLDRRSSWRSYLRVRTNG
jgi:hypothetical protein